MRSSVRGVREAVLALRDNVIETSLTAATPTATLHKSLIHENSTASIYILEAKLRGYLVPLGATWHHETTCFMSSYIKVYFPTLIKQYSFSTTKMHRLIQEIQSQ